MLVNVVVSCGASAAFRFGLLEIGGTSENRNRSSVCTERRAREIVVCGVQMGFEAAERAAGVALIGGEQVMGPRRGVRVGRDYWRGLDWVHVVDGSGVETWWTADGTVSSKWSGLIAIVLCYSVQGGTGRSVHPKREKTHPVGPLRWLHPAGGIATISGPFP